MGEVPIYIERTPKRALAAALEWPGWARLARAPEEAIQVLWSYGLRYQSVAVAAGLGEAFARALGREPNVVEVNDGGASTDFGAPNAPASADLDGVSPAEATRLAALVRAAWERLEEVAAAAPEELTKGPRGGGRDTSKILEHVVESERSYARKVGVRYTPTHYREEGARGRMREEVLAVIAEGQSGEEAQAVLQAKGWPLAYAAREFAWHALDHAWEIEDRIPG